MKAVTRFVLLGHSRSGSTLVARLLDSHPYVVCDGEILNPQWGYFPAWLIKPARWFPDPLLMARSARTPTATYGCKIFIYHMRRPDSFFRRLHRRGWKLVLVSRQDVLRTAISYAIGKETQVWHRYASDPVPDHRVRIDADLIVSQLQQREGWIRAERRVLSSLPHHTIIYERDLRTRERQQAAVGPLLTYLGLPPGDLVADIIPSDSRPLSEIVVNLDKVLAAVSRSQWAFTLDRFNPDPL